MTGTLSDNGLFTMREPGGKLTWYLCDNHIGNCTNEKDRLANQTAEIEKFLNCKVRLTPRYVISDRTRNTTKNHIVEIIPPEKTNADGSTTSR